MAATFNSPVQLLVLQAAITDAATNDYDVVLSRALTVLHATIIKGTTNAAAANTVQLQTTAGAAVSNLIDGNINAGILVRAGVIDDLSSTFVSGAALRIHVMKAGGDAGYVVNTYCIPA